MWPSFFFYCLLKDRPDLYLQTVKELWETGKTKIGTLKIEPKDDCKKPRNFFRTINTTTGQITIKKLPAIDWITLATLRDSSNKAFDYQSPDNQVSGITMDGILKEWFRAVGVSYIYSTNFGLLSTYLLGVKLKIEEVCKLNDYIDRSNHVVTLIGTALIDAGGGTNKSHWIVWEDKIRLLDNKEITVNTPLSAKVKLKVFSWGVIMNIRQNFTLKDVLGCLYGGVVFPKIP